MTPLVSTSHATLFRTISGVRRRVAVASDTTDETFCRWVRACHHRIMYRCRYGSTWSSRWITQSAVTTSTTATATIPRTTRHCFEPSPVQQQRNTGNRWMQGVVSFSTTTTTTTTTTNNMGGAMVLQTTHQIRSTNNDDDDEDSKTPSTVGATSTTTTTPPNTEVYVSPLQEIWNRMIPLNDSTTLDGDVAGPSVVKAQPKILDCGISESALRFTTTIYGRLELPPMVHPNEHRVTMQISMSELPLSTPLEWSILQEIVGTTRLDQKRGELRMSSNTFGSRIENKRHLVSMLNRIVLACQRLAAQVQQEQQQTPITQQQ